MVLIRFALLMAFVCRFPRLSTIIRSEVRLGVRPPSSQWKRKLGHELLIPKCLRGEYQSSERVVCGSVITAQSIAVVRITLQADKNRQSSLLSHFHD